MSIEPLHGDVPVYRQDRDLDCGVVCAAMLAAACSKNCSAEVAAALSNSRSRRWSFREIRDFLDSVDVRSIAVRAALTQLIDQKSFPCIARLTIGHFVILAGVREGHCIIHDPRLGKVLMEIDVFDRCHDGHWILRGEQA